ncbi:hypothetical protein HMI54_005804 [Coelomomyces lativittatus]|nr:hypothetical protein HMI54_005804 [Coelomomyces lativittatus]KAJ1513773.1 hypothetical protein HMI56_001791 [Coelomomyces lativittatus]KAJ1514155.1 hypothetical protein HMI55_004916 [Coelomomyces lativittatus]
MIHDYYGTAYGPLVTSVLHFICTVVSAVRLHIESFLVVTFGSLAYGLRTCSANVIQQIIVVKDFHGENFPLIFSLILPINIFASLLGSVAMLPSFIVNSLAGGTILTSYVCLMSFFQKKFM